MTRACYQLRVRLYADEDSDLIAWATSLDGFPHGAKAVEIRTILRQGLAVAPIGAPALAGATLDLAAIRQVVEGAVATALAQYGPLEQARPEITQQGEVPEETTALLAHLGASLVLD